jgi:hypothetical protein
VFALVLFALVAGLVAAVFGGEAARADPEQHVWVHYDYMVGANGESYAPDPAGIQIVVDSFKRHGVILHIDPQHTAIPLHSVIVFDAPGNSVYSFDPACTGPDAVGFSALKAKYFHPTSDHPWHYVIFGKYVQIDSFADEIACYQHHDFPLHSYDFGNTGYAELLGYNFVVTLGQFYDYRNDFAACNFVDFETLALLPCWPVPDYEWATMFMHELGHNLGLYHGGYGSPAGGGLVFTDNNKPNYVSVMNYAYSNQEPIVTSSTTSPSGYWYRVDYSDETLPPLDEHNLDETAGIGPTLHPTDYILWCCQFNGFAPANGPIDWNQNGTATDTHVSGDINNDGQLTVLKGFNDWDEVHQYLATEDNHPKQTQGATP